MKALLIALLVLTACGKATESPVSPAVANASQPDAKPQVVVAQDQDPAPVADPTFKVTFKFQYITGIRYEGNRNQFWWYTFDECDAVRYMTDAELVTLEDDYSGMGTGCSFTVSFNGDRTMDCQTADRTTLPYTNGSFCEWTVPYGVAE